MTLDLKLFFFLNNLVGRSRVFDSVIIFFSSYLQYFLIVALLALLYFSAYSKQEKIYIFWTTAISAVVARLGIIEIIRFFYHRPRPFINYDVKQLISENAWSFPSGHSAFFFAFATAIYLYNKKWGVWFFIAAIFMNISRITAGVHYPSDILSGAVIGTIIAYIVFHLAKKIKSKL